MHPISYCYKLFTFITIVLKSTGISIMHIKLSNPVCAKPLISGFKSKLLLHFIINFIIREKLPMRFRHFVEQSYNILLAYIAIAIDTRVCNNLSINKVIYKIRVRKLTVIKPIETRNLCAKLCLKFVVLCSKIFL